MTLTAIKETYRTIMPASLRVGLWRLRNRIRNIPAKLQLLSQRVQLRLFGRCHACQGKALTRFTNPFVAQLPFGFYQCRQCGFIFVLPPTNLSQYYTDQTQPEFGSGEEIWNRHYLDTLNKQSSEKGELLELGFGNGSFLQLAHQDGWNVHGADLSELQVKYAREELKLPDIRLGMVEDLGYEDNFFNAIAAFNFLEHVPDPLKTARHLWRILKPEGIILLMCPNIAGLFHRLMPEVLGNNDPLQITWCPPYHLSYFNKSNLKKLLENAGFQVVSDDSRAMSNLWRQFEPTLGPKVTSRKLQELLSDLVSSSAVSEEAMMAEFYPTIKNLLVQRMTWTMLSDLMAIEPLLGAEVGTLVAARKVDGHTS